MSMRQSLGESVLEVKPLLPEQWPLLKAVRLKALADAPEAFATTLAQAQAWPDGEWQGRARRFAADPPAAAYVAFLDGKPCGMVSCYSFQADGHATGSVAELTAFWVAPERRGQGAAQALIDRVVKWATAQNITAVQAWVTEDGHRAIAFYEKTGFRETGQRQAYTPDSSKQIILLARSLAPPDDCEEVQ